MLCTKTQQQPKVQYVPVLKECKQLQAMLAASSQLRGVTSVKAGEKSPKHRSKCPLYVLLKSLWLQDKLRNPLSWEKSGKVGLF